MTNSFVCWVFETIVKRVYLKEINENTADLRCRTLLLWSQIRHWGFLAGCPGTCSTSLQYISRPFSPQVALVVMRALVAKFSTAGNNPANKTEQNNQQKQHTKSHKITNEHNFNNLRSSEAQKTPATSALNPKFRLKQLYRWFLSHSVLRFKLVPPSCILSNRMSEEKRKYGNI